MKKITFNGKNYNCPETWDDVTVKMIVKSGVLDEILPDAPIVTIISAYTDIPVRELTTSKQQEVEEILKTLEFIYTPYEPVVSNEIEFRGEKYYAETDILNQSFGDWVSIQTILYNYRDNAVEGLPRMIAVLCKKEGETIDSINVDERAQLFEELPITKAKNVEGFFLASLSAYKTISHLSSMEADMVKSIRLQLTELKSLMKQRKADSGGSLHTKLLIGYYQIYLWYLTGLLERYFNSTPSEVSKGKWKPMWKKLFTRPQVRKSK